MYGGHIVEDWDRRLAAAYLLKYFNEGLLEGMEMFPSFNTPANSLSHKQVRICLRSFDCAVTQHTTHERLLLLPEPQQHRDRTLWRRKPAEAETERPMMYKQCPTVYVLVLSFVLRRYACPAGA
jgi:hypothetical protein